MCGDFFWRAVVHVASVVVSLTCTLLFLLSKNEDSVRVFIQALRAGENRGRLNHLYSFKSIKNFVLVLEYYWSCFVELLV
jgi:hypothetical protein